ncbi:choice-of-anchor Q domain-containing protein [Gimesia maris]|uniref:choice-of-anchor Q domain-containing protein n=1 Tax=Gimesia maris TaxID=122 RepID=UPI00242013D9|nr:choice-of-anchor Q domain-containing protein [Gimesia maris]|tara:strand:+ start:158372 stop:162949 length:4578 start_codon:yes stop_codon:yes gene_type:complete
MFRSLWLTTLNRRLRNQCSRSRYSRRHQRHGAHTPSAQTLVSSNVIESLEDRTLLTTFTVVNTDDSGTGSLRGAIEQANASAGADTISFDAALAGETIVLTTELQITDDLTITGLGSDQLTLDGNSDSRIFNISDGSFGTLLTVEIRGLALTNGFSDNGGAISNYEDLTVKDCLFSENDVSSVQIQSAGFNNGGAIRNVAGTLEVSNTTFSNNLAVDGGAIYNSTGTVNVMNSMFSENMATTTQGQGGGIYGIYGSVAITECSFLSNSASGYGGGIGTLYGTLSVTDSFFSNNSAGPHSSGSAIYNDGQMTVTRSVFSENSEKSAITNSTTNGTNVVISDCDISENDVSTGAIYNLNGSMLIIDSRFTGNNSVGGGIANLAKLTIVNSTISANFASGNGSGIDNSGVLSIINSTISGNGSNTLRGGGIYNSGVIDIVNSTLTANRASYGGGIYNDSYGTLTVSNTIIAGNTVVHEGAQVSGSFTSNASIIQDSIEGLIDPVLKDNGGLTQTHALLPGSAAINAGTNNIAIDAELTTDQRGAGFARIIYGIVDIGAFEATDTGPLHFLVDSATDTDDGDYSVGNLSLREAIKLSNESATADTITFDASLFDQTLILFNELVITDDVTIIGHGVEHLTLSGDGTRRLFRIDDENAEASISVELSGFTLTNGFANYSSGGAIHSLETLSISEVVFADNQASVLNGPLYGGSYGGAIYSGGDLTVTNSTFVRNSADWYGGAIYSTDGLLTITGCDFSENQTSYAGGAIVAQNGDLAVSSSTFTQNSSDTLGGGIYITQGVLTVSKSVFTENSSVTGGAIYHQISSTFPPVFTELSITDCTFQGNTTTSSAGAVYYSSALTFYSAYHTAYIENSHFLENSGSSGGALYLSGKNVLITDSTFFKNSASLNGGGISSYCDNLTVQNSLFEKNSSQAWGGGIYSKGSLVLQNSTLSGNTALVVGGGIAFDYMNYPWEIINSTLTGNAAARNGGGIYVMNSLGGTITNSIVAGNTAASAPQVLYYVTKTNSIVQDSVAGLLDPVLRDNGGVTKTHALLPGSAAINGGDNNALNDTNLNIVNRRAITQDQRGEGYERIVDETIDIGAFEVQHTFAEVELRIVDEKTTTQSNGEQTTLPDNLTWIDEWTGYWLEIWISTPAATDLGVLSAAMNLSYNTAIATAVSIEYGPGFTINQTGIINDLTGMIENLSAETRLTDVGDDQRVLFARIRFESTDSDGIDLDLAGQLMIPQSPGFTVHQTEVQLVGNIATEEVQGPAPETLVFANPYDLNDDDKIDYRDLLLFINVFNSDPRETNSGYAWFADLDQNHSVNYRDLISFVGNYGRNKTNQSTVNYPQGFPENRNKHLTVDPKLLPQLNARPVEQVSAETMLSSVVESLDPQLTAAQNAKLAQVDIEIVDLPEGVLSNTVHGTIYIDVNAAGYGWFVDDTPDDHSEFYATGPYTLVSVPYATSNVLGKIDLWTVILHELGHLLGYDHDDDGAMQESLAPSERRLMDWEAETDAFFSTLTDDAEQSVF